ncbi:MAG: FAD-dependent oxidoreductase [Gammaproteobacteria bacterium]|nr:FAD-dependent oxidoreductase [Gammaproteobacteria bacterium]
MKGTCVIVGASHAAAQLGPSLRESGWEGRIIMIGDEPHLPYHRPPLSKEFLAGRKQLADIRIRPEAAYRKAGIEFLLGRRVTAIDRERKRVRIEGEDDLPYDVLALTIGSRARRVDLPGTGLPGVHYLRNISDVDAIRPGIRSGAEAVIVGGGYIGLETAAVLRAAGMRVTVVEMMDRVMQRVTAPDVSAFYTRVHREEGVDIRCNIGVAGFEGHGRVEAVRCSDGTCLPADLVIIGVGIVPNTELARAAGLKVENGIVVDDFARTSDAGIVAAGDCTWHQSAVYDRWLRLESVQNAVDQARAAAGTLCGKPARYDALPWFWSDQYDLKLQIAGLSQGYDEAVTRGDRDHGRSFAAIYLKAGRVIAVDAVNRPPEFMIGKKLITGGHIVDRVRLADAAVAMRDLLTAAK